MRDTLRIHLFGKFQARRGDECVRDLETPKMQELFSFLLLHRERPLSRETLATQLWGDSSTIQSKEYLRKTLWQLQKALDPNGAPSDGPQVLVVEPSWIRVNATARIWLDVSVFEEAYAQVRSIPGQNLDAAQACLLDEAVALYRDGLLVGLYQDWCFYERERLQNLLFAILDKLMTYSEARQEYERGVQYGERILRLDRAHEATHRRLMRLLYALGDRTGALRQYQRCVAHLNEELGVRPSSVTRRLYDAIAADLPAFEVGSVLHPSASPARDSGDYSLVEVLAHLREFQSDLNRMQQQVQRDIQKVEQVIGDERE